MLDFGCWRKNRKQKHLIINYLRFDLLRLSAEMGRRSARATAGCGMRAAGGWAGVVRYLVRCLAGIVRRLAGRSVHGYAVSWIERPRLSSQSPISGRTIHEMNERWTERPTCVFALAG